MSSILSISLSGIGSEVENALYSYLLQPLICVIQDVINYIIYGLFYFAKVVCDVFFSFVQAIYNFILTILSDIISLLAGAINNIISTLRSKLVPAFVVAITPKAEEELIRYTIRGVTSASSVKQGIVRGLLGGLMGIGIPLISFLAGSIIDSVIPNQAVDVTNLLFPIQTLRQLSSDICCPISAVIPPQCKNTCGAVNAPVCTPPCLELSNGNTYCFGVQFISQTATSTTTSVPPSESVTLSTSFTVTPT
ncbi:hypothetical protein AFV6_gp49 [Betalipothrixvirus pozzuoliense]|uniref:Uncharacterized protein n=1 Tax=Betalipothrixvirus pozzuoliense TaxID=346882 RepID=A7WKK3_9VIRU|nr:hypothetical protein AFV6_gp49 [Acidianus filamentous virus 6]CAJ31603.1 conserved hypothetical protein [Acidianus filamentous virus 6]